MLRIAIVEDNDTDREIITDALGRFETEENEHFSITEFHDAMDFLEQRKMDFQMVFMDIQMPYMDGNKKDIKLVYSLPFKFYMFFCMIGGTYQRCAFHFSESFL